MKSVVEHLSNLIRIPSVSSLSNRPIIEYAAEVLHDAKWQTRLVTYQDAADTEKINLIAAPPGYHALRRQPGVLTGSVAGNVGGRRHPVDRSIMASCVCCATALQPPDSVTSARSAR